MLFQYSVLLQCRFQKEKFSESYSKYIQAFLFKGKKITLVAWKMQPRTADNVLS